MRKAQISLLLAEKITFLDIYLDFDNIYLKKLFVELFKRSYNNKHTIDLEIIKVSSYKLIYSLDLIKFKILKIYIKINCANGFIYEFECSTRAIILFFKKLISNFCLYVDYYDYNNYIIEI